MDEKTFTREERFIVIKRKHLNERQERAVRALLSVHDIGTVECVVVESDWPEYETVWAMIEARTTGNTRTPSRNDVLDEAAAWKAGYAAGAYRQNNLGPPTGGEISEAWAAYCARKDQTDG